jgi:hypothetical protein
MEKIKPCKECPRPIILGQHQVERFWPNEKTTWLFHRGCYIKFKAQWDAKRARQFQEETNRIKGRAKSDWLVGACS